MALATHIYYMATQHYNIQLVEPLTYGTVIVLLAIVLTLNLVAIIIRTVHRRRKKW